MSDEEIDKETNRALDRIESECRCIEELYERVRQQMTTAGVVDREHFEDMTDHTKDILKEVGILRERLK